MAQAIFAVAGNKRKPLAKKHARKTMRFLQKQKIPFIVDSGFLKTKNSIPLKKILADFFLIFGGDGTLLHVIREMPGQKPVLGINCGKHGKLMLLSPTKTESAIKKILEGKFSIEKRARLQITADGKRLPSALNEVIVAPTQSFVLSEFKLKINAAVSSLSADAICISTPTGSTAFAFSAGGKKISAHKRLFELLPVNAFSGQKKPLLVSDNKTVSVFPLEHVPHEVIIDGQRRIALKKKLVVKKSNEPALFVRLR